MKRKIFFIFFLFLIVAVPLGTLVPVGNNYVYQVQEQPQEQSQNQYKKQSQGQPKKQEIASQRSTKTETPREDLLLPLSDEDFIVKNDNTVINLDGKYEDLKTDEEVLISKYPDEIHLYDTYIYEDFVVSVSLDDSIFRINLLSSELETSRGIKIGDSLSDVFEKYGHNDYNHSGIYSYDYNYKHLNFHVDKDNKVTNIRLTSL